MELYYIKILYYNYIILIPSCYNGFFTGRMVVFIAAITRTIYDLDESEFVPEILVALEPNITDTK